MSENQAGLDQPVTVLKLTTRAYNCLKREGIHTVGDLTRCTEDDLHGMRSLGAGTVEAIRRALAERGLDLCEPAGGRGYEEMTRLFRFRVLVTFGHGEGATVARLLADQVEVFLPEDGISRLELTGAWRAGRALKRAEVACTGYLIEEMPGHDEPAPPAFPPEWADGGEVADPPPG